MSIALMTAAWALDIGATDKIVLLALADRANDDGQCWPGITSLAKKCGLSERSVQRAIQALVDAGHVARNEKRGVGVVYHVNPRHSVTPDTVSPVTDCPKTPDTVSPNTSEKHQRQKVMRERVGFADFWSLYPKRVGRIAAEASFERACKRDGTERVMAGVRRYAANHPPDRQFIPNPQTWLNQGRYDDEDEPDDSNANHGNNRRMGGSDKPPAYRRDIGLELLRELAEHDDGYPGANAGPSGVHHGTVVALPLRSGH